MISDGFRVSSVAATAFKLLVSTVCHMLFHTVLLSHGCTCDISAWCLHPSNKRKGFKGEADLPVDLEGKTKEGHLPKILLLRVYSDHIPTFSRRGRVFEGLMFLEAIVSGKPLVFPAMNLCL